jgi:hypothetical protein
MMEILGDELNQLERPSRVVEVLGIDVYRTSHARLAV